MNYQDMLHTMLQQGAPSGTNVWQTGQGGPQQMAGATEDKMAYDSQQATNPDTMAQFISAILNSPNRDALLAQMAQRASQAQQSQTNAQGVPIPSEGMPLGKSVPIGDYLQLMSRLAQGGQSGQGGNIGQF